MVAVWGYVQRNYFLTKRYFMWEVVWLVYVTINAMAITFIGAGVEAIGGAVDAKFLMTYLLVGALLWNYLSMLFDVLSETVEPGNYEAIYSNMPVFGLAKATEHVQAVGGRETARRRLMRGENEPGVPSTE